MNHNRRVKRVVLVVLGAGFLGAGPCGITTLQLQDFLTSTLIRTSVSTLAQVIEAAVVDAAVNTGN